MNVSFPYAKAALAYWSDFSVRVGFYRPVLTLSMRVFDPRDSAYVVKLTFDGYTNYLLIGERAKRARRYLVMFMETRDIYIRLITRVSV